MRKIRGLGALLMLFVSVAGCAKSDPRAGSNSDDASNTDGLVFLTPTFLPSGLSVMKVHEQAQIDYQGWGAKVGRSAAGGGYSDVVNVFVERTDTRHTLSEEERSMSAEIEINGVKALVRDSPEEGTDVDLLAEAWDVSAYGHPGARNDVVATLERLRLPPDGDLDKISLDGAPEGMVVIGSANLSSVVSRSYSIEIGVPNEDGSVWVQVTRVRGLQKPELAAFGYSYKPVPGFRNRTATMHDTLLPNPDDGYKEIVWTERPGVLVSVSGEIKASDIVAIAKGLRAETERKWRSHMPISDDGED